MRLSGKLIVGYSCFPPPALSGSGLKGMISARSIKAPHCFDPAKVTNFIIPGKLKRGSRSLNLSISPGIYLFCGLPRGSRKNMNVTYESGKQTLALFWRQGQMLKTDKIGHDLQF
jgi:hypothetical protein